MTVNVAEIFKSIMEIATASMKIAFASVLAEELKEDLKKEDEERIKTTALMKEIR